MTTTKIYRNVQDYMSVPDMDEVKAHFVHAWSRLFISQYVKSTPEGRELAKISTTPRILDLVGNALKSACTIQLSGQWDRDVHQVVIKLDPRVVQDRLHGRLDNKVVLACRRPAGDAEARLGWLDELLKLDRRVEITCCMTYLPRRITRVGMRNVAYRPTWIERQMIESLEALEEYESWTDEDWRQY